MPGAAPGAVEVPFWAIWAQVPAGRLGVTAAVRR